ncbi:ankyrin repeat domain-containing protein [archaeon]|nr:MAG: ankyrin repeat domain-containing protein [archaeon]
MEIASGAQGDGSVCGRSVVAADAFYFLGCAGGWLLTIHHTPFTVYYTPYIILQGDATSVHQLLLAGEDPNCCDLTGSTAMVAAATNQHPEVVKRLFKAGGDVNMTDRNVGILVLDCMCMCVW